MKPNFFKKLTNLFKNEQEASSSIIEQDATNAPIVPAEEKRKYFRVALLNPLVSTLQIVKVNGKAVETKHTHVLVEEIGPGGLQFLSELHFPTDYDMVFSFEAMIVGEKIQVDGRIQWKKEKEGLHHYGIEFVIEENDRKALTQQLNKLLFSLKKDGIYPKSQFYYEERTRFFKIRQRKI